MLEHKCLQFHLSTVRWENYKLTPEELDSETWQRYQHNLQLCQGLYASLHLFEISLRNHLQQVLNMVDKNWYKGQLSQSSPITFTYNGKIFKAPKGREHPAQEKLKQVYLKLSKTQTLTEDKIVAELTLGFWVELLSKTYKDVLWRSSADKKDRIKQLFPHLPTTFSNDSEIIIANTIIYPQLKAILFLRNRIFHHEPVWRERHFDALSKQMPDLAKRFLTYKNEKVITFSVIDETLHTILGWLCEDLLQDAHTFRKV